MSHGNKKIKKHLSNQLKAILEKKIPSSSEDEMSILEFSKHHKALRKLTSGPKKVHAEPSSPALRINYDRLSKSMKREVRIIEDEENDTAELKNQEPSNEHETLYGKHFTGDEMVDIGHQIYCKRKIYEMALSTSHRSSHIARKLLDGIVKKDSLLISTLTGRPARAQGINRQNVEVIPINFRARKAIVEFSLQHAKDNAFKVLQDVETVEKSMSQRIGEIKRMHELEKLRKNQK